MSIRSIVINVLLIIVTLSFRQLTALPNDFVYLKNVAPEVQQDIRYHSYHNFVGRPIDGYTNSTCILTKPAAIQLSKLENTLLKKGYSLKVYDCYRPQRAVNDFVRWSHNINDQITKQEFYPTVNKGDVFKLGYVAARSGHSRGSTMDLTIVPLDSKSTSYHQGQQLIACFAAYGRRFKDNTIDMGTGFDCFNSKAYPRDKTISKTAFSNRMMLRHLMMKYGFAPYPKEWWHFTLKNEPFPNTYFNFPVK